MAAFQSRGMMRLPERKERINDRIRAREIRVIGEDGAQLGIMPPQQALDIARQAGLDLVEVAPNSAPPVCRIMDYGRFLYEQRKKEHAAKRKQKQFALKECNREACVAGATLLRHNHHRRAARSVAILRRCVENGPRR